MSSWPKNMARIGGNITVQNFDIELARQKYQERSREQLKENKKWLLFYLDLIEKEFHDNEEIRRIIHGINETWKKHNFRRNFRGAPQDFYKILEETGSSEEILRKVEEVKRVYERSIMKERMKQELREHKERGKNG